MNMKLGSKVAGRLPETHLPVTHNLALPSSLPPPVMLQSSQLSNIRRYQTLCTGP